MKETPEQIIKEMGESILKEAESLLQNKEQVQPIYFVMAENEGIFVAPDFSTDEAKHLSARIFAIKCRDTNAAAAFLVSEMWGYSLPTSAAQKKVVLEQGILGFAEGPPSQHPNREESLLVMVRLQDGRMNTLRAGIMRDKEKPYVTNRHWASEDFTLDIDSPMLLAW